jgi:threonine/homoserine/homoserine lactone efflux protein
VSDPTIYIIFTTALVVGFSGAMMPGPLLAVAIGETTKRGFWAGPWLMVGHAILELALVVALVAGLSTVMDVFWVRGIIGLVGGTIMVVMGFMMLRKGLRDNSGLTTGLAITSGNHRLVVSGIVVSLSNPYWFIWWVTIGAGYLMLSWDLGVLGVSSFFTGHILADVIWYSFVSFTVASGRKFFSNMVYHGLLIGCGVFLLGFGAYFIVSGARFF